MKQVAVVGAGFSGATVAHLLANQGYTVDIFEARSHVAGNCYTVRDEETGVNIHTYGPHIFHTSDVEVWNFVRKFGEFFPFVNRVKAITGSRVFSLPVNLLTINQFFGKTFSPAQAREFIEELGDKRISNPQTFEEQALRFLGRALYEAFFEGYTIKQWGLHPSELPASILKRLPVRFNYDDNYYPSVYQGIPERGYTYIVERMIDHSNINLHLNTEFTRRNCDGYNHVFFSGSLDNWFDGSEGALNYRTLDFVQERHAGDYQGNPVINYCEQNVPWTRIAEHKHFAPWESHEKTIIFKEYSRLCEPGDTPYYPIRLVKDKAALESYIRLASKERKTTFIGRLGTYRYLDMHVAIGEASATARKFLTAEETGDAMSAFSVNPLA
jgi:UDP-galactopyranose mutase